MADKLCEMFDEEICNNRDQFFLKLVNFCFKSDSPHEILRLIDLAIGEIFQTGHSESERYDRIKIALLKLAAGNVDKLFDSINLAKTDWRDLLMAAGFGYEINEYKRWAMKALAEGKIA